MPVITVATPVFQNLVLKTGEDAHPIVIVILGPAIERMIVTLGALNTSAQKKLSRGFTPFGGGAGGAIKVRGRILIGAAAGSNDLPSELIDRFMFENALADPAMKNFAAFS